jgi:hypothetical protein
MTPVDPRPIAALVLVASCYFGAQAYLSDRWGPLALSAGVALAALLLFIRRRGGSPAVTGREGEQGASTPVPRWIEIGSVGPRYRDEFATHAKNVLATVKRRGQLSNVFIAEPTLGAFGRTRRELSSHVLAALDALIEGQSAALMMTPQGYAPVAQPLVTPDVVEALEGGHGIFLIGTAADGTRRVGLVLLSPVSDAR